MELDAAREAIRKCKLFRGLGENALGAMLMKAGAVTYDEGSTIYMSGELANDTFALVVSGLVSIMREDGDVLLSMGAGEVIGEIGIFSPQHRRTVKVVAAEKTKVLEWQYADIKAGFPEVAESLKALAWERVTSM